MKKTKLSWGNKLAIILSCLVLTIITVIIFLYYTYIKNNVINASLINENIVVFVKNEEQFSQQKFYRSTDNNEDNRSNDEQESHVKQDDHEEQVDNWNNNPEINASLNQEIPSISFIVINAGLSKSNSQMLMQLPADVAIGISPYASNVEGWVQKFSQSKHDIFAHLPLENITGSNMNGYLALLSYNKLEKNLANIQAIRDKFVKLDGFYIFGKENFASTEQAEEIFKKLHEENTKILYLNNTLPEVTENLLNDNKNSYLHNTVVIDEFLSDLAINSQFNKLVELVKNKKYAIGVIRTYPISIKLLLKWLEDNKNNANFNIIKISEIKK